MYRNEDFFSVFHHLDDGLRGIFEHIADESDFTVCFINELISDYVLEIKIIYPIFLITNIIFLQFTTNPYIT